MKKKERGCVHLKRERESCLASSHSLFHHVIRSTNRRGSTIKWKKKKKKKRGGGPLYCSAAQQRGEDFRVSYIDREKWLGRRSLRSFVVFVVSLIVTTRVYENRKNLEREMRSSSSSEVYRVSYQKGRVQKGKKKRDCVHSWDSFVSFSSISKRGILSTVLAVMPSSSDSSQSTGIKKK